MPEVKKLTCLLMNSTLVFPIPNFSDSLGSCISMEIKQEKILVICLYYLWQMYFIYLQNKRNRSPLNLSSLNSGLPYRDILDLRPWTFL